MYGLPWLRLLYNAKKLGTLCAVCETPVVVDILESYEMREKRAAEVEEFNQLLKGLGDPAPSSKGTMP